MPRLPRINFPNGVYHVTVRGNGRAAIFLDDDDQRHAQDIRRKVRDGQIDLSGEIRTLQARIRKDAQKHKM